MKEKKLIEKLRRELEYLIKKTEINNNKVIVKSQELDELMYKYQKRKLEEKNNN